MEGKGIEEEEKNDRTIYAKTWSGMPTADIVASLDIALNVLEEREIDADLLRVLLDVGIRCLQIVEEQWADV
jgi:hypothetical protein